MDDVRCPRCRQVFLHTHSILVGTAVHYEWECSWCGHTEGDYESVAEAKQDYEKKYGGNQ